MISRYFISFNFAALITFGLFFAMQLLIQNGEVVLVDPGERIKIELGEMPEISEQLIKFDPPVRPVENETPETITLTFDGQSDNGLSIIPDDLTADPRPTEPGKPVSFFASEGDFTVILRPAPQYPTSMAENGIEGFVRVKYTITKSGSTDDVMVVNSSHRGFERSALKAAQKFKFKPRVEDGEPQEVLNVNSLIEFKLED